MIAVARYGGAALLVCIALPLAAQDTGRPQSAIGWLEEALAFPSQPGLADDLPIPGLLPPEDELAEEPAITVAPLSAPQLDQIGLFAASRIGLPRDLWSGMPVAELISGLAALPTDTMPAALQLSYRLLLAEFDPPEQMPPETRGTILTARIDKLIAMGALETATQLLDAAPVQTGALNSRAFDIALLLGEEHRACAQMQGMISAEFGHALHIFCLARQGAWQAAHTTLDVAQSLGLLEPSEAQLLRRFLEEEEAEFLPAPPAELTPLGWRILEALGDPVPTSSLPVAYAHADLRGTSGWRAQLDAAERLTRAGVMPANRLLGLYAARRPAASGGVWERVRAVQLLDQALQQRDAARAANALSTAWPLFERVELEMAFAEIFAERLADIALEGDAEAQRIRWKLLMLTRTRLDRASEIQPDSDTARLVMALAAGDALPEVNGNSTAQAIRDAFDDAAGPANAANADAAALPERPAGAVMLDALSDIALAAAGDARAAQNGLAALRVLGLDSTARQIAIELLLLERRG